jgi:putative ABC transport system permease protein
MIGLIAFATFWCNRKRNEVSIRKVLGAGAYGLIWKFYTEFSKPILISFVLAIFPALYLCNRWLQHFACHVEIDLKIVAFPLLMITIITVVSVGAQTLKVTMSNPVRHLQED